MSIPNPGLVIPEFNLDIKKKLTGKNDSSYQFDQFMSDMILS